MKRLLFLCLFAALFATAKAQAPFIREVSYRGAFAPTTTPWTDGWTNFNPQNATYGTTTVTVDSTSAITSNTQLLGALRIC